MQEKEVKVESVPKDTQQQNDNMVKDLVGHRTGRSPWLLFVICFIIVATAVVVGVTVENLIPKSNLRGDPGKSNGEPTLAPSSDVPYTSQQNDGGICSSDELLVEFFIQLDHDSYQNNGWTLQCDKREVWNIPPGYLEELKTDLESTNQMTQSTCVKENETCDFTIQDTLGDGLIEDDSYFYLTYGAQTVAAYDKQEFYELSYCFGPKCEKPLLEEEDECNFLYLSIGLDANPEETEYEVECNDEIIFVSPWDSVKKPFEEIQEETCMTPNSCCRLTVKDSAGNGLTEGSTDGTKQGWIYFEYGAESDLYNGQDGAFEELKFEFGC